MLYAPRVEIDATLVDRLIDLYCDWRAERSEVRAAYAQFGAAPRSDRAVAFAAYGAALDREQRACEAYAAQVRFIQALCVGRPAFSPARAVPQPVQ